MYFDANTASAIDVTNNALKQFTVGSLAEYARRFWEKEIVQIKKITLGEYTKAFKGYKSIVIPSLMVENVETHAVYEVLNFVEGGWSKSSIDGKKWYDYPAIYPFAYSYCASKEYATLASYRADSRGDTLTVLSKLEAKKLLEDIIAKQVAAQEEAKRAALLAQQQQLELQRQNDAIKDEDITALLNKLKNNR